MPCVGIARHRARSRDDFLPESSLDRLAEYLEGRGVRRRDGTRWARLVDGEGDVSEGGSISGQAGTVHGEAVCLSDFLHDGQESIRDFVD
jgi:hypothetical protein